MGIAFMFILCINLQNVAVSSSHHTELMFLSTDIFHLSNRAEASVDIYVTCFMFVMIYSLNLFSLHFVTFSFYQYTKFSTSPSVKTFLSYLDFSPEFSVSTQVF